MNNNELTGFACEQGENIKILIRDFYLNCIQNGFYDMKENAGWFIEEYDLDASFTETIQNLLIQVDLEYKNKFNQCMN